MPRDNQRSKVYLAETDFQKEYVKEHKIVINKDLSFWDGYLKKVLQSKWFQKHFGPIETIRLKDGKGTRNAKAMRIFQGRGGIISLPLWSRDEIVVLHELSHVAVSYFKNAPHGPEFCAAYLKIVKHFIGTEAENELKMSFKEKRVKWRKKKTLSLDTLEKLRQRGKQLAAARKQEITERN